MEAIQTVISAIQNDNTELLKQTLQRLPLYLLDVQRSDTLLIRLLTIAANYQRKDAIKIIIDAFESAQPSDQYRLPIHIHLFELLALSDESLAFIINTLRTLTFADVVDELVKYDSGPMTLQAIRRADDLFGAQDRYIYETLMKMSQEYQNDVVTQYLAAKVAETAPFAPIPGWVRNFVETMPEEKDITLVDKELPQLPLPNDEELVDLLTSGLSEQGISFDIEEAKATLRAQLAISSREEKINIAAPVLIGQSQQILGDDEDLFRIMGPVNAYYDIDLTMNHKCSRYGGCRMLYCTCFANYDYDDDFDMVDSNEIDWFTGSCEECLLKIRRRPHAFRIPRVNGAWRGCYCSIECARKSITDPGLFMIINAMMTRIEGQLNRIGIQDRYDSTSDQRERADPQDDWRRIPQSAEVNLSTLLPNHDPEKNQGVSTTTDNVSMIADTNLSGVEKLFVQ